MKTINLRKFYGSVYKTDTFIELPDEIADALESGERIEHYSGQKIREHTYSIDYSPEIEYHFPNQEPSAEEILLAKEQKERMVLMLQCLQEALATLTPMQKRRLEARFAAAMKYREIADEENVSMTSITTTVRDSVLKLRDYFIKHGWLESPKEATVCTRVAPRKRIRKKIRQLENQQKILLNRQRDMERRVRTRRLIEHGAILESVFPELAVLPGEQVKAFLLALSRLPEAAELLKNTVKNEATE